ncbi:MAG TPA: hypothetical protein VH601_19185 [Bryobacteraceae bacterium]|jgi:hypothetical protein
MVSILRQLQCVVSLVLLFALLPASTACCAGAIEIVAAALRSGHTSEALRLVNQALDSDPQNNRLFDLAGNRTFKNRKLVRSARFLQASLEYLALLRSAMRD